MSNQSPPWEPPFAASEAQHLVGMLERLRATLRWKTDGLDAAGLRFRIPSSALSLGGLLKHLAVCEDDIFAWKIAGEEPITRTLIPAGHDRTQWQFSLTDDETPDQVYALYDQAVARSRARLSDLIATGRLDTQAHLTFGEIRPSIRRFVCDLIEEYGRHTGHADLIREALDGRVGEDPPHDWRPAAG